MRQEQPPQFLIREATIADTEAIRRMHAASWLDTYPNEGYGVPYEWVKEYTDTWLTPEKLEGSKRVITAAVNDPNGLYRVVEKNGEIVGLLHASTNDDDTKELEAIYLHPDVIGVGLGQQLLQLGLDWSGGKQMSLEVAVYNERAIGFYEKYGFKIVEGTESLYRDKIPVIKMVKEAGR